MHMSTKLNYAKLMDLDSTALEMHYADSDLSFVIVLPNRRMGLSSLEKNLKNYDWAKITDQMQSTDVVLTIPKYYGI